MFSPNMAQIIFETINVNIHIYGNMLFGIMLFLTGIWVESKDRYPKKLNAILWGFGFLSIGLILELISGRLINFSGISAGGGVLWK